MARAPCTMGATMSTLDLKAAQHTLHTQRLRLETARPEHAAAFADGVAASMASLTYVTWGLRPRDVAWALRFCEDDAHSIAAGQDLAFHVFALEDGAWVGRIDVHHIDFDARRGEIGYVGNQRRTGRGLMREATLAVIEQCFQLGFMRIEAMSDARNTRALHFATTLGLQFEGLLRQHERDPQGQLCDMALYAVLNPWPEPGPQLGT